MCSAPVEGGYSPLMIVVLAGAQTGALDHAVVYRNAPSENLSRLGDTAYLSP